MKRNDLILVAFFALFSLLTVGLLQLHAELTLQQAQVILNNKIGVLNGYNIVLGAKIGTMENAKDNWDDNEQDIQNNRIDYATADPWGLGGAFVKQVRDFEQRKSTARALGAAIKAVQTAKTDADGAQRARDTAWTNYVKLADENNISTEERLSKGPDALSVSYPDRSISCPSCPESWSGSGIGGLADHITSCSVKGHTNLSGDLVSDPLPHFTCETCPLAHQHYTFACEGGCGEMFPQPTHITTPHGGTSKIYHDHRYPCEVDVPGIGNCPKTAYTCQTPECENDANHLKEAPCGKHTVLSSEFSAHEALPDGHARKGQCTYTHNFDGTSYQCIVMITHKCDLGHGGGLADQHDFNPDPSLVYPSISPKPEPVTSPPDNTPNCPDCTSHCSPSCNCSNSGTCNGTVVDNTPNCSYCTDGCSSCQTPTTVSCARSGCSESVSSPTEHRVPPCSSCGKGYWTCGDYATYSANQHRVRTCRRSGCGNTWQRCTSSTPDCNVASGQGCYAADP